MGHGPFMRGIIQFVKIFARYRFGNYSQMRPERIFEKRKNGLGRAKSVPPHC